MKVAQMISQEEHSPSVRLWTGLDLILGLLLSLTAGTVSMACSGRLNERIKVDEPWDRWFDSDYPLVLSNMTVLGTPHRQLRTKKHPLFALLVYPIVRSLTVAGISEILSVRILLATVAALWTTAVYSIVKLTRHSSFQSFTFSLLAVVSSSSLFWTAVPDTYVFGSLSILSALLLIAAKDRIKHPETSSMIASILTLGVTTTNWVAGVSATLCLNSFQRSIQITTLVGCLVVIALIMQWALFGQLSIDGFPWDLGWDRNYLSFQFRDVMERWRVFVSHSVLMPEMRIREMVYPDGVAQKLLSIQTSSVGSRSSLGIIGVCLWSVLLISGLYGLSCSRHTFPFRACLATVLLGQFVIHSVYGPETFVHSAHFGILLILVASWSTDLRYRSVILALAWILIIIAAINNGAAFLEASDKLLNSF